MASEERRGAVGFPAERKGIVPLRDRAVWYVWFGVMNQMLAAWQQRREPAICQRQ